MSLDKKVSFPESSILEKKLITHLEYKYKGRLNDYIVFGREEDRLVTEKISNRYYKVIDYYKVSKI